MMTETRAGAHFPLTSPQRRLLLVFTTLLLLLCGLACVGAPQAHAASLTLSYESDFDFDLPKAGTPIPTKPSDFTFTEKGGKAVKPWSETAVRHRGYVPWSPSSTFKSDTGTFTAGSSYQFEITLNTSSMVLTNYADNLYVNVNGTAWTVGTPASVSGKGYIVTITSPVVTAVDPEHKCGWDDIYWHYYGSTASGPYKNMLAFIGSGEMKSYSGSGEKLTDAPWANYASELKTVFFDGNITKIGSSTFSGGTEPDTNFSQLSIVFLPKNLVKIDSCAFANCTALKSISLPDRLDVIGRRAFAGAGLESISISKYVTEIGDGAFEWCTSLSSLELGDGLLHLGEYNFRGCSALTEITIPASVSSIGYGCFENCTNLEKATMEGMFFDIGRSYFGNYHVNVFDKCNKLTIYGLANSDAHVFALVHNIPFIPTATGPTHGGTCGKTDPAETHWKFDAVTQTLDIYGNGHMQDYEYNTSAAAPWHECGMAIKHIVVEEGVKNLGAFAFSDCGEALDISLPSTLTSIGEEAFRYCTSVTELTIPSSVASIGEGAFNCCWSATSITLPAGLTEIADCLFLYCSSLESVTIPEGVTTIGAEAFKLCSELQSIVIPAGVTSIGNMAFYGCEKLKKVDIKAANATVGNDVFSRYDSVKGAAVPIDGVVFNVPKGSATEANLIAAGVKLHDEPAVVETVVESLANAEVAKVADITWTGKAQKPALTVALGGKKLIAGIDYTIVFSSNKNVGTASATITGTGGYSGSKTITFDIVPKPTKLAKVKGAKKALSVKWKKQSAKMPKLITGYELQIAKNAKFTKGVKTVKVKGWKKTSKKVKSLKAKKKYWVKIRTYKTAGGKTYYSAWSKSKAAKVK